MVDLGLEVVKATHGTDKARLDRTSVQVKGRVGQCAECRWVEYVVEDCVLQ